MIAGLALDTTPLEILRAALEAVAHRFALIHELLRPLASEHYQIVGSGGGMIHWPVWPQIVADALGEPLVAARDPEASARGAALLALEALGALPDLAEADTPLGRTYTPVPDAHKVYRAARQRLERLDAVLVADPVLERVVTAPAG